jgi:uncharacterized protein (TIGR03084 family)
MLERRPMRPPDPPAAAGLLTGPTDDGSTARRAREWVCLAEDLTTLDAELQRDLAGLSDTHGQVESLCPGWTVRDVVVHLVVGDALALRALSGEDCFPEKTADEEVLAKESLERVAAFGPVSLGMAVDRLVSGRRVLLEAIADIPETDRRERVPWVAGSVSRLALVQSRLMETWVHGRDLRLPLGLPSPYDDRCWWINDLGARHVPYSLAKAGLDVNLTVALALDGPGGGEWSIGTAPGSALTGAPVTIAGPSWAWLVASAQRAPGRAEALAHLAAPAKARPVVSTARSFA